MEDCVKYFKNNKYALIGNFLNQQIVNSYYYYMLHMVQSQNVTLDEHQIPGNLMLRDDIVFDTLLSKMRPVISSIVQKNLLPTYAFCRYYQNGQKLKKHTDREACEYSMTINLGWEARKPWPIYLKNEKKETRKVHINVGDGLIYKGRDLTHWRKKFKGEHQVQLFLHYVDADGEFANWCFDKRPGLNSLDYDINSSLTFYPNF